VTRLRLPLLLAGGAVLLILGLLATGLFRRDVEPEIDAVLARQIGQMLMVGFQGTAQDQSGPSRLARQIADGTVGGVLVLGRNVESLEAVEAMNRAFLAASPSSPPLIAIDQEGGRIQRLRATIGFPETPSAAMLGRYADPETARDLYAPMAGALAGLGFNVNFGPVVDLDLEPGNPIISRLQRAYSDDPDTVTDFARAFVETHRVAGLLTAPKHFPGHGTTLLDSHETLPDISETWDDIELAPYRQLIAQDLADMVMVGHLVLDRGDGDRLPATLSPGLVTGLLRGELGFEGVIVSDDLQMGALMETMTVEAASVAAIRAGIDLLIVANYPRPDPGLPERLVRAIASEAISDTALRERIEESAARIGTLKRERLGTEVLAP
jgi:beta-N-acetylhexosaminidase